MVQNQNNSYITSQMNNLTIPSTRLSFFDFNQIVTERDTQHKHSGVEKKCKI